LIRLLAALLLACALVAPARADDTRPLTVRVVEETRLTYRVTWKIPANLAPPLLPALARPAGCAAGEPRAWSDPLGHWREERWRCREPLAGSTIGIDYPAANPGLATIARLRLRDADEQTLLLQPQDTRLAIPASDRSRGVFVDFLELGFEHIWRGLDHLLFVAGLIFVAGSWRRVLLTVTGFTLAHSLTLALAALDLVRLPARAIEAAIALSIVFLAVEIVKGPRDTLTWRRPVTVAASFGLLHGFGFAAVLREIGMPAEGLAIALLAFNLGIEAGQAMFAALVMGLMAVVAWLGPQLRGAATRKPAGYLVGTVACYWMFERLTA
jgi:hypothetical protein